MPPSSDQHQNTPPLQIDIKALAADLNELRNRLRDGRGPDDIAHLKKMARWGKACTVLGYATAWIIPNPVSAALISQGKFSRWAMIAHHVMHRGYDKTPGVPSRLTSRRFARGWRRYADWLDWERVVINVNAIYRELDPNRPAADVMDLFRGMAELKQRK